MSLFSARHQMFENIPAHQASETQNGHFSLAELLSQRMVCGLISKFQPGFTLEMESTVYLPRRDDPGGCFDIYSRTFDAHNTRCAEIFTKSK